MGIIIIYYLKGLWADIIPTLIASIHIDSWSSDIYTQSYVRVELGMK